MQMTFGLENPRNSGIVSFSVEKIFQTAFLVSYFSVLGVMGILERHLMKFFPTKDFPFFS